MLEDTPGCGDQRGQRRIVGGQPPLGVGGLGRRAALQLDDDLQETARVDHRDLAGGASGLLGADPGASGEHQNRIDQLAVRGRMVVAQVARVGGHLVHVGALEQARLLELEDDHLRTGENHHVGPPAPLPRQLVLEDDDPLPDPRHEGGYFAERGAEDLVLAAPGCHLLTAGRETHDLKGLSR